MYPQEECREELVEECNTVNDLRCERVEDESCEQVQWETTHIYAIYTYLHYLHISTHIYTYLG